MKTNELRIGNYIQYVNSVNTFILKVEIIYKKKLEVLYNSGTSIINSAEVLGIPLTDELLLQCGFEQIEDIVYYPDMKIRSLYVNTFMLRKNTCSNLFEFHFQHKNPSMHENVEVKSLHQLQNLYFALTGKELEVKL